MDPAVAVMIVLTTLIIAALAVYLIATIVELRKIAAGLDVVGAGVGEIVAKTAPVNGVLDAINGTLVTGRDLLEGLFLKKAGADSAGLVESLFPGEGANFLRRVGRTGKVVNVGTVYTRGVGTLAALGRGAPIGAAHVKGPAVRDPQYSTTAAAMLYPRPGGAPTSSPAIGSGAPATYEPPAPTREQAAGGGEASPAPSGRISIRRPVQPAAAPPPPPPPPAPPPPTADADAAAADDTSGRLNARGARPWEATPEADADADADEPSRLNVRGSRPWER